MKKLPILQIIIFFFLLFFLISSRYTFVYSNNAADQIESEIEKTQEEIKRNESILENIERVIRDITSSTRTVNEQINLLNDEITKIKEQIDAKESEIQEKLEEIDAKEMIIEEKKDVLAEISRQLYMESRVGSIEFFFSVNRIDDVLQTFFIRRSAIALLKGEISEVTGEFENLALLRDELEDEKKVLDEQKGELDESYDLLAARRSELQRELTEKHNSRNLVSRNINGLKTELSDLQYQLLVVRQGGTNVNLDSVPSSGEFNTTLAGFQANAPSGSFGIFSIGAYTHRNGMSQWGARARADAGQSYTQIMSHYYPGTSLRTGTVVINGRTENIMDTIHVTGHGTRNFEDNYLLGIYEVPESWPMEILKAQAIAARTYAVRRTSNGRSSICATEACQVYRTPLKTGRWKQAVEATRGVILVNSNGTPALTQYAAVHGGWTNTSGWDTTDGTGNGDWMARAWDSISGVSWFYRMWYRPGYSNTSTNCGRNPWLSQAEMADILHAYQVWVANNRSDNRIVPIFDACNSSGNPYSHAELRNLASQKVSSISAVVTSNNNGSTSSVTFYTNAGTISMSGNDFKTIYNMRAPGHIRIPQNGFTHINIERK